MRKILIGIAALLGACLLLFVITDNALAALGAAFAGIASVVSLSRLSVGPGPGAADRPT